MKEVGYNITEKEFKKLEKLSDNIYNTSLAYQHKLHNRLLHRQICFSKYKSVSRFPEFSGLKFLFQIIDSLLACKPPLVTHTSILFRDKSSVLSQYLRQYDTYQSV